MNPPLKGAEDVDALKKGLEIRSSTRLQQITHLIRLKKKQDRMSVRQMELLVLKQWFPYADGTLSYGNFNKNAMC
jgi:hypothetical protein